MRNDEAGGSDDKRGSVSARVEVHPTTNDAARGLMTAMAVEFDRWMADEVEELAESITVAAGSTDSPHVRTYLHELAGQLARQAEALGYPDVGRVAARLSRQFDPASTEPPVQPTELDMQIAELRMLLKR
jgi:hypothetical protein